MQILKQHTLVLKYLHDHLNRNQFLILAGILVGLTTGIVAVFLKSVVHNLHVAIDAQLEVFNYPYLNLFLPLMGILLTVWVVKVFLKGKDGKGISNLLIDIAQRSGIMAQYKMYSQVVASALTVGFGGSAGLEGPIAVTGGAIGSNFARIYKLSYRERILLIGCGAASGIAAAFNAPITGMMFAIEVILVGAVFSDFIPLIISAVCGALISKVILDDSILLEFKSLKEFDYQNIFYYILLGIFSGLVSVYYSRSTMKIEHFFKHQFKWSDYSKAIFGGLILALLCFLFPPLFGEGYSSVKILASGSANSLLNKSFFDIPQLGDWALIIFVGFIFIFKSFAYSFTVSSGGSGGNFAPSLFAGAFSGYFFAAVNNKLNYHSLPVGNFTLVGMCGVISGVMYAPLTGIFLIAEVTGGYDLILPLMLVSTSAYAIARMFEPYSMEKKHLIAKKQIFTEDYDQNLLGLISPEEIIDNEYEVIYADSSLIDLLKLIRQSTRNIIVCKNHNEKFVGFILFDKVRKFLMDPELQEKLTVKELISKTKFEVDTSDSIVDIINKFEEADLWYLPAFENGEFKGFISKTRFLSAYRNKLRLTLS
ncbi:chloride channel protein [Pedobacter sp. SD-b]|uniref:Chloride channel protein n=1 Tax=Pedobacter segetis TaxID=2793069 RepID=A0ABS1BH84_9SPHI|nr:chloride channel protein [Pedobacter segetis]